MDTNTVTSLPLTAPTEATMAAICNFSMEPDETIMLMRFPIVRSSEPLSLLAELGADHQHA
jgi:hypothetical protein